MNYSKNGNSSITQLFVITFAFLALLFLVGYNSLAQTPTPTVAATSTLTPQPTLTPTITPTATPTPSPTATPANADELARFRTINEEERRKDLVGTNWYFALVTLAFIGILLPFGMTIVQAVGGTMPNTNNRPLGLPVGSFRAILAYTLVTYLGFYVLTSILSISLFAPPDFLLGIVATVIGFYFGSRSGAEEETNGKTGTVRGVVRQGMGNPARGALIKFKRTDDGTEPYSRISDIDGRFELKGAKQGKYKVQASLTDPPSSAELEISVTEGSDHEIEIVIKSAGAQTPQTGTVKETVTKPD